MEMKDAMSAASVIHTNSDVMNSLEILKIHDVMAVLGHLTNEELLKEIQEQSGVIQDAQAVITAAAQLRFERA